MEKFESIFIAALELYKKFGFQKVNVQEIADAAGVSKKTIYNHFDGKENLFHRTFEWHIYNLINFYDSLLSDNKHSLTEKLIMAINHASREIQYQLSPVYKDIQNYNPYLKSSPLQYIHNNIQNAISGLVDEAQKEGLCRKDLSKENISYAIRSMISGLFLWDEITDTNISRTDLFNTTMTLILDGLLTDKGRTLLSGEKIIL
ncbi:MAG: TetR/AcrR family transcriptional regulator [Spirochaetales bacterium]|nr:TetR/AcrR family transcriptional regulator [Spirochaetales bacterium]